MPFKCCVRHCKAQGTKFSFPKEKAKRNQWLRILGRNDLREKNLNNYKVCEFHFRKGDVIKTFQMYSEETGQLIEVQLERPRLKIGVSPVDEEEIAAFSNLPSDNCLKDDDTEMDDVTYLTDNQENLKEEESTVKVEPILPKEPSPPTTSRKRVYGFPRFIQDLGTAHFSTPDKTRIVLSFIRDAYSKKTKKIRDLQRIVSRLNKRIRLLEDALLYLHDKGLISEENLKEAAT